MLTWTDYGCLFSEEGMFSPEEIVSNMFIFLNFCIGG